MFRVLFLLSLIFLTESNVNGDKLIHTQIIFRHGDRTIRLTYANDPYKDEKYWPEGLGRLTNRGKKREYELGEFFRRRYGNFIGEYSPNKLSILSSGLDRTINSANLVLAAMFPPEKNQVWNEKLLWQPIAVHSTPLESDYLIYSTEGCPRFLEACREFEDSPKIQRLKEQNRELIEYIEKNAGEPIRTLESLRDIYNALDIEYTRFNKSLPKWTDEVYIPGGAFEYIHQYFFKFQTGTTELKRLKSGFLLKDILDRFKNKTLSLLPNQLMQLYSGHDETISGLLNTLNLFELHAPPYASCVIFELYESDDSHYVQLFYRNTTVEKLQPMNIPGCGTKCTIDELYALYKDVLPTDFETECRLLSDRSAGISQLKPNFQSLLFVFSIYSFFQ